jgi:tRNA dimethylallyltransferase
LVVCLTRERAELYARIERRADALFAAGLVGEVEAFAAAGLSESNTSMKGIGYKEVFGYLRGEYGLARAVELVRRNSRRYAKRQLTWFRRYPAARWFNLSAYANEDDALADILSAWRRFAAGGADGAADAGGLGGPNGAEEGAG